MTAISKIEQELLEVTAFKLKKKEDRQKYLARLMNAVSDLPDPEWEGLSTEAQEWNNAAAENFKASGGVAPGEDGWVEIADFPDYEEEVEEEVVEEAAKPEKTWPNGRRVSACHRIKMIVAKDPKISVADLASRLKEDGLKVSDVTIATLRSDLRDTLRVLNELKMGEFSL